MLLQIKSSVLHLAAIVADGQSGGKRGVGETAGDGTDWNLQFCREEAITSQVNIQPPERQRRVLHKAADVWADVHPSLALVLFEVIRTHIVHHVAALTRLPQIA